MAYVRFMILSKLSHSSYGYRVTQRGGKFLGEVDTWLLNPKEEKGQEFDRSITEFKRVYSWTGPRMKVFSVSS